MASVLIVDDEPDIREVFTRVLEREHLNVRVAADGAEALASYRHEPADVVITDVVMPKLDGIGLIRSLREQFPGARVIAISGGGDVGQNGYEPEALTTSAYLVAAEQAGADVVLTKPIDREDLVAQVLKLCNGG